MERFAHVYVFDTLADWEPGHAVAELNTGRYLRGPQARIPVRTFGVTKDPVRTMGGLTLLPEVTLADVRPENTAILLLSGGNTWLEPVHAPVLEKVRELLGAGVVVAAICGATVRLACDGLLDKRPHTSNDLGALKAACPSYRGADFYKNEPAVTDGNLITGNGVAPLDFAFHILKKLDVMTPPALAAWSDLFRTQRPESFFALMQAVQSSAPRSDMGSQPLGH